MIHIVRFIVLNSKDDGSDSAFIMMADIHYYYKTNEDGSYESHGSEISEGIMQK